MKQAPCQPVVAEPQVAVAAQEPTTPRFELDLSLRTDVGSSPVGETRLMKTPSVAGTVLVWFAIGTCRLLGMFGWFAVGLGVTGRAGSVLECHRTISVISASQLGSGSAITGMAKCT